jgi:hypothetical protein
MILCYYEQSQKYISEKCHNEPVEYITKQEWMSLIHFDNDEISTMPKNEIQRRISALKSIVEAPHYSFGLSQKDNPKFMETVRGTYDATLNGSASYKISILEDFIAGKGIPQSRL